MTMSFLLIMASFTFDLPSDVPASKVVMIKDLTNCVTSIWFEIQTMNHNLKFKFSQMN